MLEGDIILRWYGFPNQTTEPVMAHPPAYNSDNTLDNWLNSILATDNKAPKLDFKVIDHVVRCNSLFDTVLLVISHANWF